MQHNKQHPKHEPRHCTENNTQSAKRTKNTLRITNQNNIQAQSAQKHLTQNNIHKLKTIETQQLQVPQWFYGFAAAT